MAALRFAIIGGLVAMLAALPLGAEGQQAKRNARIGFLSPSMPSDPRTATFVEAFRQGLHDLGWNEGRNITIEYRWAEDRYERLAELARGLAALKVDVILAATTPGIQAARQATTTIPIVMANAGDAMVTGFVASLGRPGANITGMSMMVADLVPKQLQILKEVAPKVTRVAVLWNPKNPSNAPQLGHAQEASRAMGIRLQPVEMRGPGDVDEAFAAMTREHAGALVVLVDAAMVADRARIAALAARHRLPAIYGLTDHVKAGGLMAYGSNVADLYRRSATFVDRILKGDKPGDLPVEQPTKFDMVVNLSAAKALGLTFPQSVRLQATEILP